MRTPVATAAARLGARHHDPGRSSGRRTLRWPSVVGAAAVVVAVLGGCGGGDDDAASDRLPDLELPALDDGVAPLDVGSLTGPAVVNLWATWCPPCRAELPAFQQVAASHDDVRFVGVNSTETGDARAFLDGLGVTYDQYVDPRGELAEALGAAGLPVTIVVDSSGSIVDEHLGPLSATDLEAALADVS